jgi:hypothetical protein
MQPIVAALTSLDVYRDGGSMSASFLDDAGLEYTLLFKIRLAARSALDIENTGFFSPILEIHRRADYTSPVTGKSYTDWATETISISWSDAIRILNALRPHFSGFQTDYPKVFPSMLEIAQSQSP